VPVPGLVCWVVPVGNWVLSCGIGFCTDLEVDFQDPINLLTAAQLRRPLIAGHLVSSLEVLIFPPAREGAPPGPGAAGLLGSKPCLLSDDLPSGGDSSRDVGIFNSPWRARGRPS